MSPRIKMLRKVLNPPQINGFNPYGSKLGIESRESVNLFYEEYEALRLCDYDGYNHQEASAMMSVSRPTFTRIYASALRKIAKAFVEGKQITIKGGKVYFDSDWYQCHQCRCYFNNPEKDKSIESCPLCGNHQIEKFEYDNSTDENEDELMTELCKCPNCGFEQEHQAKTPCKQLVCKKCHTTFQRNES